MEKERRIKTISVIALVVAVLGLTVAFAVLSANLVINGTAKVDPGTWNIYFDNLSEAKTKGGAQVTGDATINTDEPTKIEGINVTLTKPMDEVIYTVELKNDGDIDAEISSINGPDLNANQQKYVEFSAIYNSDKKAITEGDILRGGATEIVTISIKFKKEVTELPGESLNIPLSYEINYVQSDKSKDEEAHKGESTVPKIDYDSLDVSSTVNLGEEEFYVIENSKDTITLLAKYNLLVGNMITWQSIEDIINTNFEKAKVELVNSKTTGYGLQNQNAKAAAMDNTTWTGTIEFEDDIEERTCYYDGGLKGYCGYWTDGHQIGSLLPQYGDKYPAYVYDSNSKLYNYVEEYKKNLENMGYDNIEEARLMTYDEATELGCDYDNHSYENAESWVYSSSYWTGFAVDEGIVIITPFGCGYQNSNDNFVAGIRPVIVLNK